MSTNVTNKIQDKKELIYPELSYSLVGILFSVHNDLGRFCREKQYSDCIEEKLKESGIYYKREYKVSNTGNILDFLIDDKIIIEVKAKMFVTKEDYYQTQRYLQATGMKLALLVNFRSRYLSPKRIIKIEK